MAISDQIIRLQNAKAAIKTSIENKGVTVGADVKLDGYPSLIDSISGGSGCDHVNGDFYNVRTLNSTDYSYLFYNYKSFELDLSPWDTSNVINMEHMFDACVNLTNLDSIYYWNVSKVEKLVNTFYNCQKITELDLSRWNTTSLKEISGMFSSCSSLTSLNLSGWNVSGCKYMSSTFYYCSRLITLNLSGWDTSIVTSFDSAFNGCSKLQIIIGELDCSGLKDGLYTFSYKHPFKACTSLETLYLKNIYKNVTMTNASKYSINLGDTKISDTCLVYIINQLPDLINDKGLATTDQIVFTLPPTNTLTAEQVKVATDKGWQVSNIAY